MEGRESRRVNKSDAIPKNQLKTMFDDKRSAKSWKSLTEPWGHGG